MTARRISCAYDVFFYWLQIKPMNFPPPTLSVLTSAKSWASRPLEPQETPGDGGAAGLEHGFTIRTLKCWLSTGATSL